MALSDILKKYSEEAREGIMAKDPKLDKGIMPYKTSKATTPVYNLDTDTITEKVSVNFEPSGLMKATEGIVPYQTKDLFEQPTMPEETTTGIMGTMPQATTKPVTEEAPFMPDMGLPIPTPEPVEAQPFITGPTSVISYGTVEEGTPRLLTDTTTGETVYADSGQPYTPPPVDDDTPPVFYNMWVNASASANDVEKAQESLETKGLTISSGSKSTYEKKDNSGNVTGYRFLIVSNS